MLVITPVAWSQVNVVTESYDNSRTSSNLNEAILNTSNVNVNQFGKLFSYVVDGSIYAQPLYVSSVSIPNKGIHNVVYVATMNDVVYAFDADDNADANASPLWTVDLRNPGAGVTAVPFGNISPENFIVGNVGIEGTPVIDLTSNTMYLVAFTVENGAYIQRLHALDITSGAEKFGGPPTISGFVGNLIFDPLIQNQRPALAIANGMVFIAWASYGDLANFHGWVMAYDAKTLRQVSVFCVTPSGSDGGIWMSGRGPAVDSSGNVYYMTANGDYNGTTNFSDSFIKLVPNGGGLSVSDWFTPDDFATLSQNDQDLGASGPILIPGTNLIAGAGKESILYLMSTANMGHEWAGNSQIVQWFSTGGGSILSGPAYYDRGAVAPGPWMYIWPKNGSLEAFHFNGAKFDITPVSQSTFQSPSGSQNAALAVTANGGTPGTGIVWAAMPSIPNGGALGAISGIIHAFDAGNLTNELWNSSQNPSRDSIGNWGKFRSPLIVNGKLYVASFSNFLGVYGLLSTLSDFTISASSSTASMLPGGNASYTVNIGSLNGFAGSVNLSVSGLPQGASASLNPTSVTGSGSLALTIMTAANTTPGDLTLTITGTSGNLSHAVAVTLAVVSQIVPTITWATPAPITVGTALSGTQLNATASVPGTFAYTPAVGTVLVAGSQTLSATFTPTDTVNYTTATATVLLIVNQTTTTNQVSFVASDSTTQGNWMGTYGGDGYSMPNVTPSIPSFATFTPQNVTAYTWVGSTTDARALETGSGTARIASTWYNTASFSFDVNITDGSSHLFALYALDWDSKGRVESIQILNAGTNTVLDTRTISSFSKGVYLVWDISGHMKINVILISGPNAAISGAFFGGSVKSGGSGGTGGGTESVSVSPQSVSLTAGGTQQFTATVTGATSQAVTWSIGSVTPGGAAAGSFSSTTPGLYAVPATGTLTAATVTVTATSADGTASGTATVSLTNPVTSGAAAAAFAGSDTTTQGSWHGVYGADGYSVANDSQSIPGYASFAVQNQSNFTWAQTTGDVRALQTGSGAGRIAATWYNATTFNFDVNFTDGGTHQFALYALDWDHAGRAQSVVIQDATTKAILDSRTISNFGNGIYLIWNISGHVKVSVSATSYSNVVISGVFWGGKANQTPPTVTWATPAAITFGAALGATQLNATASVPGTFTYTPASGTVPGAGSQTLSVKFTPTDAVDYATVISTVTLVVNQATPTLTWTNPAAIFYGTALSSTQLSATVSVPGTFAYTPVSGTVLGVGSQTLSAKFTPTDATDYATATATATLVINQTTPAIAWANPATISYGTSLSGMQLNATTSVPGTFIYAPAAGTVPGLGSQTLAVTFTPTDTIDYTIAKGNVTLTVVNQAIPTITWTTPPAITYGTALSSTQLNAVASAPGTLVYTPAAGTVLNAGSRFLSVTFTPTDTGSYTSVSATVTLVVNQATPAITWTTPAAITYGTALSGMQLNATASVPGTLAYTPTAGTVLGAGSQTLAATFTPADTVNYTTATATVPLFVNQATTINQVSFVASDSTTQGNWMGTYGADGYSVVNIAPSIPSFATFTPQGAISYTWASSTTDARALQTGSGTARIASTWYNNPNFSFDVNITDGSSHQFELYALDWDNGGRAETIQILNAGTNAVLDTRSISNFSKGVYLVWNISGHVKINVIWNGGANAVISGAFFGGNVKSGGSGGTGGGTSESVSVSPQSVSLTAGATQQFTATVTGAASQSVTWSIGSVNPATAAPGSFSSTTPGLYTAPATGTLTAAQVTVTATSADGTASGSATVSLTSPAAGGAVAIFQGPDTATQGSWHGIYGADGYSVPNDSQSIPGYATFSVQNQTNFTWAQSTGDLRAPQTGSNSGRIASAWYGSSFKFDVDFTDGKSHEFALYALDWDSKARAEIVQIVDATTNTVLDTRALSAFSNGIYLVWAVSGHIKVNVALTNGPNAVISGAFFGGTSNQAVPKVTWSTPPAITYGTALSATQLNATASVPGTFAYTPASGTVPGAGNQTLSVKFTPTDAVDYATVTSTVTLIVNQTTPPITWTNPAAISYGTALNATQLNATATVPGNFAYTPASGAVLGVGSHTLSVVFTPTDTADFTTANATATLVVNQAMPTIIWANPATISYGTALSATQLNATTTVPGTFVYTPVAGTVLGAGSQTLSANFTPTDTTNYTTATANVTLTVVNQAVPTITWITPAPITHGTALTGTQLNATASVPGTFAYTPAAGTVLNAGSQTLSVTFTPNDTVYYATATASVILTVNKITSTVTWSAPAAITYGTALSGTQLNATTSVPGTFVYTPMAGTVLSAGSQSLSVTFTPTDTVNYTTATASVTLTVTKVTSTITWSAPAAITYGTALNGTQLNATTSVPGTFVYTPAAGTVLDAGSQTLSVTFTPLDTTDYTTANATVTVLVNPVTSLITWATPAAISYGTALTVAQLNATASVLGTFVYTPAAGTVLSAGSQTLSVTFTPSDSVNYAVASATVQINVTAPSLYVVANDKSRGYSDPDPTFDVSYAGFGNGDTPSRLSGALSCASAATPASSAGMYAISCSGLSSDSYAIVYVNGQLTITNPLQSIAVNPASSSIQPGDQQQLTASGTFEEGSRNLGSNGGSWASGATVPIALAGAAAAELNGHLYLMGGTDGSGTTNNTVQVYDPVASDWANPSTAVPMPTARSNARAAVLGGRLYVVGGMIAGSPVGSLDVYDPASNSWAARAPMPTARYDMAVGVINGKLYVAGGSTGSGVAGMLEMYDPAANCWTTKAPMITARSATAAGVINGVLYIAGGSTSSGPSASMEAYNPVTDGWSSLAALGAAQSFAGGAVLNEQLYAVSGIDSNSNATMAVEAYDPIANKWTSETPIPNALADGQPVAIGGLIYAAGNGSASTASSTMQVFTPDESTWTSGTPSIATISAGGDATGVAIGSSTITASSTLFTGISGSALLTVSQGTTTMMVTTDQTGGSTYGQSVTFTATVAAAPSGSPSGSVNFYDGASGADCSTLGSSTLIGTQTLSNEIAAISTSSLTAGSHVILACYGGDTKFLGSGGNVSQTVAQATPTITWTTPVAVSFGTALDATQLNATASVPGTFDYLPSAGTVLDAGSQTLSVTFTPSDTTNYTTAAASVTLAVN